MSETESPIDRAAEKPYPFRPRRGGKALHSQKRPRIEMSMNCCQAIAAAILLALLAAATGARAAEENGQQSLLIAPAADYSGLDGAPEDSSYAHPQFGPVMECGSIDRQFVLANSKIVQGEPVLFRLVLESQQPRVKREFQARLAYGTDVQIFVDPPEGLRRYEYLGLEQGSVVPNGVLEMEGFSRFRFDFRLAVDEHTVTGAAFEEPGTYKLRVQLKCIIAGKPMGDLDMGEFTLEVEEATGDDAQALEILNDYRIFEYFQLHTAQYPSGRAPLSGEQVRKLERVVELCPDAALRPHAMIVLADYYRRQGQPDQSIELLQQVRQRYAGTPLAQEALFAELRANMALRRDERARELFTQAWQDPVATQVIFPGGTYWSNFVKPFQKERQDTQWMVFSEPGEDPEMAGEGASGPTLKLDPEVRAQFGLPEEVTTDQLNEALNRAIRAAPRQEVETE